MDRRAIAVNVTADIAAVARRCVFLGLSLLDTTGVANTVKVYDNASVASGTVIAAGNMAANGACQILAPESGVNCENGIYVDVTGAVVGSIWYG